MNIDACLSHKSALWCTPRNIYDGFMIKGYFDPCPVNPSFDGLCIDWKKFNFVNPPYSEISKWIDKAILEVYKGNRVCMLLPCRTDTQWFKKLVDCSYAVIYFVEGRLKFNDSKCAPFPSMFVIMQNKCPVLFNLFGYLRKDSDFCEIIWKIQK